jgi:hypothetical protein
MLTADLNGLTRLKDRLPKSPELPKFGNLKSNRFAAQIFSDIPLRRRINSDYNSFFAYASAILAF